MLTYSVVRKGTKGMVCVCSMMPGPPLGDGWGHTPGGTGAGWQLGPQQGLSTGTPHRAAPGSCLDFPHSRGLGLKSKHTQRAQQELHYPF